MNQILISEEKQKNKKTYAKDMKKIIIIFAILIIALAACIIGVIVKNVIDEKNENSQKGKLNKPDIKIEQIENECRIIAEYDGGISKFIYSWNDGDIIENNKNDRVKFEEMIEIPKGQVENKLTIKIIGADGTKNELTETFINEKLGPIIQCEQITGTDELIITLTSEVGIDKLTYQWENEEEKEKIANGEKEFKEKINIKRGTNKLIITAIDIEGGVSKKEENLVGIKLPEIDVSLHSENILHIDVKHDMGFKKIIIKINDQELIYDENHPLYSAENPELNITHPLEPGKTVVEITAYSLEHEKSVNYYIGQTEI